MRILPVLCLVLTGCGVTSPYVAVGTFLGVDPGTDAAVLAAMEAADMKSEAVLEVGITDLRAGDGTAVFLPSFRTPVNGEVVLDGEGPKWEATGLDYVPEPAVLEAEADDVLAISLELPAAAEVTVPPTIGASDFLSLEVGEGYNGILVTVADALTGDVLFDNIPNDADALVDWATEECPCEEVVHEGIFQPGGTYLVAVAGLVRAQKEDIAGFNSLFSTFVAGEATVSLLRVE